MKYKAIIFDFDGVLVDTEVIKYKAWQKIASRFGKTIDKGFFNKNCIGKSGELVAGLLCKRYNLNLNPLEFSKLMYKISVPMLKKDIKPIKSNISFLKNCHNISGRKIGIASSQEKELLMYTLKKLGLEKYFDAVIAGNEIKNKKPSPDIYLKACKKLSVQPKECIVIEDTETGVEAAYGAKIGKIIAIPKRLTAKQDFSKADVKINANLSDEILDILKNQ